MATGSLKMKISDVVGDPLTGGVHMDFEPARDSPGGAGMNVDFDASTATKFTVTGIECRPGPGTLYQVTMDSSNYRTYSFFQMMFEDRENKAADNQIRMVVNPGKVKEITSPDFGGLPGKLRTFLSAAAPVVKDPEDRDLAGLSGEGLYNAMGPLRRAAMLNLYAKAKHPSSGKSFTFLETLLVMRQDRCFCTVDSDLEAFLNNDERFKTVPKLLHTPLDGYELRSSFKSRDDHANIQFTLMRNIVTGEMAADVDIDEATGIEHGFEVIRNAVSGKRTNPYLVRELLVLTDPEELTLDPGYRFIF